MIPHERVVADKEAYRHARATLGGKAMELALLTRGGFPVAPWFCITLDVFDSVWARIAGDVMPILAEARSNDRASLRAANAAIAASFLAAGLDESDRTAVLARFDEAFGSEGSDGEPPRVAVRSSAVGEDSATASFAGQLDTYLFVPRERLIEAILRCFASAFSERALLYRSVKELDPVARTAVVVQRMIPCAAAGVLFTANPTNGDRTEAVLSAGWGLGEGIVAGRVETDTYYVDLETGSVRSRTIVEKSSRAVRDRAADALVVGTGTVIEAVEPDARNEETLAPRDITELALMGKRLTELRGAPQDIEWGRDPAGKLYLFQTRPITTLKNETESIFDNANVVESYPGVSLPLTFSFARKGYAETFVAATRAFGIPQSFVTSRPDVFENLISLIDGRIYYNLLNWYLIYQTIPGFERYLPAWEKALGLPPRAREKPPSLFAKALPKALTVARILFHYATLERRVEAYLEDVRRSSETFKGTDLKSLDAHGLLDLADRTATRLRAPYAIALVNDFFAQQLYELLRRALEQLGIENADMMRNELLCGERGMDSVEPVRSILALAARIRSDEELTRLFASELPATDVWRRVHDDARFDSFRSALRDHLARYGDRTLAELKLEVPPAEKNPGFVVGLLRNYLRGGQDVDALEQRQRAIRDDAERRLAEALARRPVARHTLHRLLDACRRSVRYRENLRLARSRGFGLCKRIYRAMGELFAEKGLLDDAHDIFYLTEDEIASFVRGGSVTRDVRALVTLRRAEYEGFEKRAPRGRLRVRGIAYEVPFSVEAGDARPNGSSAVPAGRVVLKGVGCSTGRAKGAAKVILDPRENPVIDREILIAPMTDPGWVFLMIAAAGLVAERGSLLSHTAIIGRELGIPTVVGVADATRRIRSGQHVEIDGQTGSVLVGEP